MDGSRPNAQNMEAAAKIYGFVVFRFDVRARCSQLRKERGKGKGRIYMYTYYIDIRHYYFSAYQRERLILDKREEYLVMIILCILYYIENIQTFQFQRYVFFYFLITVVCILNSIHSTNNY